MACQLYREGWRCRLAGGAGAWPSLGSAAAAACTGVRPAGPTVPLLPFPLLPADHTKNGFVSPEEMWDSSLPEYMQQASNDGMCESWETTLQRGSSSGAPAHGSHAEAIWTAIRCECWLDWWLGEAVVHAVLGGCRGGMEAPAACTCSAYTHPPTHPPTSPFACRSKEAQEDAAQEPLLSSFLYASILSHDNFERSLSFVLSNRLSDATFLSTELFEVFYSILRRYGVWGGGVLHSLRALSRPSLCAGAADQAWALA